MLAIHLNLVFLIRALKGSALLFPCPNIRKLIRLYKILKTLAKQKGLTEKTL
jgi:hypothetical protein